MRSRASILPLLVILWLTSPAAAFAGTGSKNPAHHAAKPPAFKPPKPPAFKPPKPPVVHTTPPRAKPPARNAPARSSVGTTGPTILELGPTFAGPVLTMPHPAGSRHPRRYGYGHYRHYYRRPTTAMRRQNSAYNRAMAANMAEELRLERLKLDLDSIRKGAVFTSAQTHQLQGDLMAVVTGQARPNTTTVGRLSGDLTSILPRRSHQTLDSVDLARALAVVMNAGHLPPAEVDQAIASSRLLLTSSGLKREDADVIVSDLRVVAGR